MGLNRPNYPRAGKGRTDPAVEAEIDDLYWRMVLGARPPPPEPGPPPLQGEVPLDPDVHPALPMPDLLGDNFRRGAKRGFYGGMAGLVGAGAAGLGIRGIGPDGRPDDKVERNLVQPWIDKAEAVPQPDGLVQLGLQKPPYAERLGETLGGLGPGLATVGAAVGAGKGLGLGKLAPYAGFGVLGQHGIPPIRDTPELQMLHDRALAGDEEAREHLDVLSGGKLRERASQLGWDLALARIFEVMHGYPRPARAATLGAFGAGMAGVREGDHADPFDMLLEGATLGGLAAMGGTTRPVRSFSESIARPRVQPNPRGNINPLAAEEPYALPQELLGQGQRPSPPTLADRPPWAGEPMGRPDYAADPARFEPSARSRTRAGEPREAYVPPPLPGQGFEQPQDRVGSTRLPEEALLDPELAGLRARHATEDFGGSIGGGREIAGRENAPVAPIAPVAEGVVPDSPGAGATRRAPLRYPGNEPIRAAIEQISEIESNLQKYPVSPDPMRVLQRDLLVEAVERFHDTGEWFLPELPNLRGPMVRGSGGVPSAQPSAGQAPVAGGSGRLTPYIGELGRHDPRATLKEETFEFEADGKPYIIEAEYGYAFEKGHLVEVGQPAWDFKVYKRKADGSKGRWVGLASSSAAKAGNEVFSEVQRRARSAVEEYQSQGGEFINPTVAGGSGQPKGPGQREYWIPDQPTPAPFGDRVSLYDQAGNWMTRAGKMFGTKGRQQPGEYAAPMPGEKGVVEPYRFAVDRAKSGENVRIFLDAMRKGDYESPQGPALFRGRKRELGEIPFETVNGAVRVPHPKRDGFIYLGEKTPEMWIEQVESILNDKQITEFADWYKTIFPEFRKRFGMEDPELPVVAWMISNMNDSPIGAQRHWVTVAKQVLLNQQTAKAYPRKSLVWNKKTKQMEWKEVTRTVAVDRLFGTGKTGSANWQKIGDFVDSALAAEYGTRTRSYMGNDPRGMRPAAIDVWAMTDLGFSGGKHIGKIAALYGKKTREGDFLRAFRKAKVSTKTKAGKVVKSGLVESKDGVPSTTQYRYGTKFYNELAKSLNEMNGGEGWRKKNDWQPHELQAIGWGGVKSFVDNQEAHPNGVWRAFKQSEYDEIAEGMKSVPDPKSRIPYFMDRIVASPEVERALSTEEAIFRATHQPHIREAREAIDSVMVGDKVRRQHDSALGGWADGQEPSMVSSYEKGMSWGQLRATAAATGWLFNQKSVLAFKSEPQYKGRPDRKWGKHVLGDDYMVEFEIQLGGRVKPKVGSKTEEIMMRPFEDVRDAVDPQRGLDLLADDVGKIMLANDVYFFTAQLKPGTKQVEKLFVYAPREYLKDTEAGVASVTEALGANVVVREGRGEFVGNKKDIPEGKEKELDAKWREDARKEYQLVLAQAGRPRALEELGVGNRRRTPSGSRGTGQSDARGPVGDGIPVAGGSGSGAEPPRRPLGDMGQFEESAPSGTGAREQVRNRPAGPSPFTPEENARLTLVGESRAKADKMLAEEMLRRETAYGEYGLGETMAENIRLDKLDSREAIKDFIWRASVTHGETMKDTRRLGTSWEDTEKLASKLNWDYDDLLHRVENQAMNAQQIRMSQKLLDRSSEEVMSLRDQVLNGNEHARPEYLEAVTRHAAIQEQIIGIYSEAGRALNILKRNYAKWGGRDTIEAQKKALEKYGGDAVAMAEAMIGIESTAQVSTMSRALRKPTWVDKLLYYRIQAMLTSPKTHAVNILSNASFNLLDLAEHGVAAGIGSVRSAAAGTSKIDRVTYGELAGRIGGTLVGVHTGFKAMAKSLIHGREGFALDKIEEPYLNPMTSIPGKIATAGGIVGRMLVAEDEFFKGIAYTRAVTGLAMREAAQQGKTGSEMISFVEKMVRNPDEKIRAKAISEARTLTFTERLGPFANKVGAVRNAHPALRFVIPFFRTPINIYKEAMKRTPGAPFLGEVKTALSKGGADRDLALARIATGSAIGAWAWSLAASGNVTGASPQDGGERNVWNLTNQEYSVKLDDKWVKFNRFDPLGTIFALAADTYRAYEVGQIREDELTEVLMMVQFSLASNMFDKTWLRGATETIQAWDDPERYAASWGRSVATSFIPAIVGNWAYAEDPYLRRAHGIIYSPSKNKLPGLRRELPYRTDIFGEKIPIAPSDRGFWGNFLNPFAARDIKESPHAEILQKYGVTVGTMGKKIEVPNPRRPMDDPAEVELTEDEYEMMNIYAGRRMKQEIERTKEGLSKFESQNGRLPKTEWRDELKAATSRARAEAREIMRRQKQSQMFGG